MKLTIIAAVLLTFASPAFAESDRGVDKEVADTRSGNNAASGDTKIDKPELGSFPYGGVTPINCCGAEKDAYKIQR